MGCQMREQGLRREKMLLSKTEALIRTGPKLDGDRSGPFCGTDSLGLVRSSDIRSVFALPYYLYPKGQHQAILDLHRIKLLYLVGTSCSRVKKN